MKQLLILAIALITLNATAQNKEKRGARGERAQLTPEQTATLKTKEMALKLDLTKSQQSKIMAMQIEMAKNRKAKREEFKKRKASKTEKPSSDELFKMKNERLDKALAHKKEMKTILTQEQFEKWEKGNHRKVAKFKKHKRKKMSNKRKRMNPEKEGH